MASTGRQSASHLVEALQKDISQYSFFKIVEMLLVSREVCVEEQELKEQGAEGLWFRVDPRLGFPSSDICAIRNIESVEGNTAAELTVNFLGLQGASSPMPAHMLEAAVESRTDEGVQQAFNDFFSNRLIWFFYLIWRKYRYYIRYRPNAEDQFSDWMFALIGIKGKEARGQSGVPWARLLTYLGIVAARTRSAEMISGVIAHAFGLKSVCIREFEERIVEIESGQRSKLGHANASLGSDVSIGRFVRDRAGKFTLVLKGLSFKRLRDFLPNGVDYPRVKELIEFLLKDQLAYDLELHFEQGQVPNCNVGERNSACLGWTTFIGNANKNRLRPVVLQVRA